MTGGVMKHVILSITPVQEFVGQARRTRDLWAGSYLLSWLSAQAMAAVKEAGGEIVMPQVDDDPMIRLLIHRNGVTPPVVGSLPNQFTARLPVGVGPEICREAVQGAWRKLAEAVWCKFVKPVKELSNFHDLSAVWTQQIEGFWEIAWVVVPPVGGEDGRQTLKRAGDLLRRRKLWRSHLLPDEYATLGREGGDHCQLMPDWRELSGYARSGHATEQDAFWAELRERAGDTVQLAEGERLCAPALVKRLFPILMPNVLRDKIGWVPGNDSGRICSWPSTRYMAVLPWLRRVANTPFIDRFLDLVGGDFQSESRSAEHLASDLGRIGRLDGNLFDRDALRNTKDFPIADNDAGDRRMKLEAARAALVTAAGIGEPATHYALLLMDGDRIGEALAQAGPGAIATLFKRFGEQVTQTIRRHDGICIYAGGDDVLALLSVPDAVTCACELRRHWTGAAEAAMGEGSRPTISAAVIFAEATVPLRLVLARAHEVLDEVAKNGNGRDSLAADIIRGGDFSRSWVSQWDAPGVEAFAGFASGQHAPLAASSGLLHAIGGRFGAPVLDLFADGGHDDDFERLLAQAHLRNRSRDLPAMDAPGGDLSEEARLKIAREEIRPLVALLREVPGGAGARREPRLNPDAALFLRFFARQSVGGARSQVPIPDVADTGDGR
ncbi:type III-B CRISPR-associated protein Cas10/Cmr2 (plasmid) [Tistrella mobilis]|uniref:Cas10/Cmr2 second palm domain-containing protein n=1 Tax=Tistrella mobilis TaxID=171437 RepID=UPI003558DA5D